MSDPELKFEVRHCNVLDDSFVERFRDRTRTTSFGSTS
jgi:hypothetical protein